MQVVSVRELSQRGVSKVVSRAESEPVLITKNNEPDVWMVSARALARVTGGDAQEESLYRGTLRLLAAQLFDSGELSLGQGARLAGVSLSDFIDLLDRLEIAVLREPQEGTAGELAAFDAWFTGNPTAKRASQPRSQRWPVEPIPREAARVAFCPEGDVEAARFIVPSA